MNKKKLVGVIGGLGPYAGVDLVQKIFDQTVAVNDQDHLSVVLFSSSENITDRSTFLLGQSEDNPAHEISRHLRQLESLGADVAAIACVTSHAPRIYNQILSDLKTSGSKIHLVHAVNELAAFCREQFPGLRTAGILATDGTVDANIFGEVLGNAGISTIYPDANVQKFKVHDAIYHADYGLKLKSNPPTARAQHQLVEAAGHLVDKGAEVIILGCTEIPLALKQPSLFGRVIIDPALILARSLICQVAPEKLRPITMPATAGTGHRDRYMVRTT